jgi:pimeloyl-ACP methyl ester carboxylesterase
MGRSRVIRAALAAACAGVAALGGASSAIAGGPPPPNAPIPPYGTGEAMGMQTEWGDPTGMPPGVVNGPCTPAADHPYPVVLVHGTIANANFSWQTIAPTLSDAGYCVFALNYGANDWTTYSDNHYYALDYVENSAAQLANFIQTVVLPDTGASAVDIVGHSQGGMMPRYYMQHRWDCGARTVNPYGEVQCTQSDSNTSLPAGASYVHTLVGLAPSNHGADAQGLVPVFATIFGQNTYTFPEQSGCGACGEQETGSPFLDALNATEVDPGVLYYVFETGYDELVTPAPGPKQQALGEWPSAYLHGTADQVLNVRLQDQCANDATEHVGIIYDPVAIQDVVSALANNGAPGSGSLAVPAPTCRVAPVPPVISG